MRLVTDEEVIRTQNHAEMMRRRHIWPCGDVLPIKKPDVLEKDFNDPNGFRLLAFNGAHWVVFIANLYCVMDGETDLRTAPQQEYDSPEAVVADGWVVD